MPQQGFEIEQEPFRKQGTRTDFIMMNDGRKAAVRTWHPSKGTFSYTATGKQYFEQRPRQYIVSIPAINHIQHKDGHWDSYPMHMPSTDLHELARMELSRWVSGADEEERNAKRGTELVATRGAHRAHAVRGALRA